MSLVGCLSIEANNWTSGYSRCAIFSILAKVAVSKRSRDCFTSPNHKSAIKNDGDVEIAHWALDAGIEQIEAWGKGERASCINEQLS
jgi:hypothetical protein